jgi:hypothetical protein
LPGQPFANVENRRCRMSPVPSLRDCKRMMEPQTGLTSSLFRVIYNWMMPRFSPVMAA